jgi:Uma2 family endonuclease
MLVSPPTVSTIADLLDQLGGISPRRVLMKPPPGTATEADLLEVNRQKDRVCELVDGVLVEKAAGYRESLLAGAIGAQLRAFVVPRNLGLVSGAGGMMRLLPGLVRAPDVAFTAWERIPGRRVPSEPIPALAPDLAVEVLSASNTEEEMARKRREYFAAGARLVWLIDPRRRTATVFTGPEHAEAFAADETLDGGAVLPGFSLPLRDLFAELDQEGNA